VTICREQVGTPDKVVFFARMKSFKNSSNTSLLSDVVLINSLPYTQAVQNSFQKGARLMIDLRSDTVTKPSQAMRDYMVKAEVGDDVYGDDPTVNNLEQKVASLLGMEAAMLVPSGTQSNLVALLTHCGRGDEYIVGQDYHTYLYESGGAASLGGIQAQPVLVESDGTIDLSLVESLIKPNDVHFAKSRLLSLENTHNGKVISNEYIQNAITLAKNKNLNTHLDGARVFNAAVSQSINVKEITQRFDSVSICCSKGLGAPIGSLLSGSTNFIKDARRWRKMVGGGMRQAGIIAAGIDFALNNNVERLAEDHKHAKILETELSQLEGIEVSSAQTNVLYIEFETCEIGNKIREHLRKHDVLISPGKKARLVTHLNIKENDLSRIVDALKNGLRI